MYHRKAFGPQRRSSRQALARDIAASMLAAQQRGEHWPITFYTQQAETIRLVEEQLAAAARDSSRHRKALPLPSPTLSRIVRWERPPCASHATATRGICLTRDNWNTTTVMQNARNCRC